MCLSVGHGCSFLDCLLKTTNNIFHQNIVSIFELDSEGKCMDTENFFLKRPMRKKSLRLLITNVHVDDTCSIMIHVNIIL